MDEESGQPGATQDPWEWMIELIGHEHDLADWQLHFRRPFDPWCERLKQGEHDFLALGSRRFDDAREPMEVQQAARILLPRLNGAMRATIGAEPVGLGVIASRVPDGPWQFSALMEAHARSRSRIVC